MKRTQQLKRTDRDITNSFLVLLKRKNFEKITVQDILDEALVNRSTFYQHFTSKYDVLERLLADMMQQLYDITFDIRNKETPHLADIDALFNSYFKKNRDVLRSLIHIKTEHVDIIQEWTNYFKKLFGKLENQLVNELDATLMANMFVGFICYILEHDGFEQNFSSALLDSFLNILLMFFRVDNTPQLQKELLDWVALHSSACN